METKLSVDDKLDCLRDTLREHQDCIPKQKVIEKIRFCVKNNLSMKRLVKELGLE
jgi:hypothetical protein